MGLCCMKRTSVMIEVDDDVYSSLVEPLKKNKSFSKLISSLLNGYLVDGYIRSFIDDCFEEVRKAVVGSFEDSVGEMESALANMGLFADELSAHSKAGYSQFQQRRSQQAEELNKDPLSGHTVPSKSDEQVKELRGKVDGLERTVTEGFNKILEILMKSDIVAQPAKPAKQSVQSKAEDILSGLSFVADFPEEPVTERKVAAKHNEVGSRELVGVGARSHEVVEEEDDSVDNSMAGSFLSSLMGGFGDSSY